MELIEFPQLNADIVSLVLIEASSPTKQWRVSHEMRVFFADEKIWIEQDNHLAEVLVQSLNDQFLYLIQNQQCLWVLLSEKAGLLRLRYALPAETLSLDEKLEIRVDDATVEQLYRAKQIDKAEARAALTWCHHEFLLEGTPSRFAVVRHLSSDQQDKQIIGRNWRADIQFDADGKTRLLRLARRNGEITSWNIFSGSISFIDFTVESQILSPTQQALMNQSIQSNGSYLKLWQKYSEKEWEKSLLAAATLGTVSYTKCEPISDEGGVWRFHGDQREIAQFEKKWKRLESDLSLALEAGETMPVWSDDEYVDLSKSDNAKRFRGRARFDKGTVIIEVSNLTPPDRGALYLSLSGDRTVQERRQKARENIESGRRLPQLHRILQQVPVPTHRSSVQHTALSSYAKECFKSGRATERQEAAIKLALNTPDIAIIIGPPGTGKTQVIAALERRLSEIGNGENNQHQVLISSFQHDAVENALNRTSIYGLPAIKIGSKTSKDGVDPFEVWRKQQNQKTIEISNNFSESEPIYSRLHSFKREMAILRNAQLDETERHNHLNLANDLLVQIEQIDGVRISSSLMGSWREYITRLPKTPVETQSKYTRELMLRKARSLRVTAAGFGDDGADRAYELCILLERSSGTIHSADLDQLKMFSDAKFLSAELEVEAIALRNRILSGLMSDYRPPLIKHRLDMEGLSLLGLLEDEIDALLKKSRFGVAGVLSRYSEAFDNHPERARLTVREYAMIVGATCQQAASTGMASLKELSGIAESGIAFNTVIIDEAARANPLDLFIPMSMANRRIVLVGDHRQLPHLLEPLVEKELSEQYNLSQSEKDAYKESLFERLWRQLKDQNRVVMLNTQFRMHPIMGAFVSRYFYEDAGLDRLEHGREAADFLSDIPGYEGKVCAWIDVPFHGGNEDRKNSSWIRNVEAEKLAAEVHRLLESCNPNTSIGVITFYSAQRDAIFRALSEYDVCERDAETGGWKICSSFSVTPKGEERLRIGTVDSFQGKEFDLVFLSMVRSNQVGLQSATAETELIEKSARSKYGHLLLNNRLNVAMSRQKSLLVMVGDSAMVRGDREEYTVPILSAFYQLCNGGYGLVR